MISHFHVSPDQRTVSWKNAGREVALHFQYEVYAHHVHYLDEVLVQSDIRESGSNNLCLYKADGSGKACPAMPRLKQEVAGVYAVWFVQGKRYQTVVLHSSEFSPYDTACTFDLETHQFSAFHPTK